MLYELKDNDSGKARSSMTKVSSEEGGANVVNCCFISQCTTKDCWVAMFPLDKAFPIQNMFVVGW